MYPLRLATALLLLASLGCGVAPVQTLEHDGVISVTFVGDSHDLVSGDVHTALRVWNANPDGALVQTAALTAREPGAYCCLNLHGWVAASADGRTVAQANGDYLDVWFRVDGDWLVERGVVAPFNAGQPAFSPDGHLLTPNREVDYVSRYSLGESSYTSVKGHDLNVVSSVPAGHGLAGHRMEQGEWVERGGSALAVASSGLVVTGGRDGRVRLLASQPGTLLGVLEGHTESINDVAISPDESRIASCSDDNTVRLWSWPEGELLATLTRDERVHAVAFSPDGVRLAVGGTSSDIRIFDVTSQVLVQTFSGHDSAVTSLAYSKDGTRLASAATDDTICVWDPRLP